MFEKYYEEIEDNLNVFSEMIEEKTKDLEETSHCFKCDSPVSPDFKFCTKCKVGLKAKCD